MSITVKSYQGLLIAVVALAGLIALVLLPYLVGNDAKHAELIGCDLNQNDCTFEVDGALWRLEMNPKPARSLTPLQFSLRIDGQQPQEVWLDITGVDMYMGVNQPSLNFEQDRWTGVTELAVCTTGAMVWQTQINALFPDQQKSVRLHFDAH